MKFEVCILILFFIWQCISLMVIRFNCAPYKAHKFQFCHDGLNSCVRSIRRKYTMDRLIVPSTLLMQERIDFIQDKATTLEEANFFLCKQPTCLLKNLFSDLIYAPINQPLECFKNLFSDGKFSPINILLHVDVWPRIHNNKNIQCPTIFKLQLNNKINGKLVEFLKQMLSYHLCSSYRIWPNLLHHFWSA